MTAKSATDIQRDSKREAEDDRKSLGALAVHLESPAERMQLNEFRELLLRPLSEIDKVVVGRYFFDEQTLRAIGAELGFTESAASHRLKSAMKLLREYHITLTCLSPS